MCYNDIKIGDVEVCFRNPLPASFFKVLPLPQKFNGSQLPLPHPCPMFYEKCFRFRLLKKSNASASNFIVQSASASTSLKILNVAVVW